MAIQLDLHGKTAFVSGSTQGIGYAVAEALARAGSAVVVNGRSAETTERAARSLAERVPGAEIRGVPADLSNDDDVEELARALPDVDVLVNNLGIFASAEPLEISDAEWRRFFEVNVLSAVRLTRLFLPGMMRRSWGRVVYISSDSAVVTPAEMIHYGMSKTALLSVSRGFAKAAAGTGVTVNSVLAGPTHTEGVEDFVRSLVGDDLDWDEAQHRFMVEHRPQSLIQRLIEPSEIANMVAYLCSPLASATTGGAVRADGGYVDAILP